MINVLGIDPSLCNSGVVYLEDGKIVVKKIVKSKPVGTLKKVDELKRLVGIVDNITRGLVNYGENKTDLVVIEGLAFMARNTSSLIQLAGLNYLLRDRIYNENIKFVIVAPTTLKKFITGKGNGPKDNMMLETYKRYNVSLSDNNLCDAYGLAQIGLALLDPKYKATKFQKEVINLLKTQL